jgi:hypothetical protein
VNDANDRTWFHEMSQLSAVLGVAMMMVAIIPARQLLAGPPDPIYDEALVPPYTLPDPLIDSAGRPVKSAGDWESRRRQEILHLFETHVYGRSPQRPKMEFDVASEADNALGGRAIRKEVTIHLLPRSAKVSLHLLLYLPKLEQPVPVFLGLNFSGNQSIHEDPTITITDAWVRNDEKLGIGNNHANEATRGSEAERWQVEEVISRGYGVASMYYGDIDPDFDDGFKNGVHSLYVADGKPDRGADAWGSIAAWAWGLSRALDYLETDKHVDAKRVAVWGHSRLGKTALWAAAEDERFAMAISNDSGCGGAALSRRVFGETVGRINKSFPHWFCRNFRQYNENENRLPVDQHMLVALIAPRPIYIASAAEDLWADPRGEFLGAQGAAPVYDLLLGPHAAGLPDHIPAVGKSVGRQIGYHIRSGKHDVTPFDWQQYLDFADRHLRRKATE